MNCILQAGGENEGESKKELSSPLVSSMQKLSVGGIALIGLLVCPRQCYIQND